MKFITTHFHSLDKVITDAQVFFIRANGTEAIIPEELHLLDTSLNKSIHTVIQTEQWNAKERTHIVIHTHGSIPTRLIVLIGLGDSEKADAGIYLKVGARLVKLLKKLRVTNCTIAPFSGIPLSLEHSIQDIAFGMLLGDYEFVKYKKESKEKHQIESVSFLTIQPLDLHSNFERMEIFSQAVFYARDIVNEPPSNMTPSHVADKAISIADSSSHMTAKIFSKNEIEELEMGGLLAIARGSSEEPKFIHLTYNGGGDKVITLVGKGVTFDSGGLSLKPSKAMETMKCDMAGAALVLGVFSVLSKLKPNIIVHGLIPTTENMPGTHAIKPGDVVTSMNGKTIEILNTDAEGRIILADALSYAEKNIQSNQIIDVATLTGACVIALGEEIAGLFCNDAALKQSIQTSATSTHESLWELPLAQEYESMLSSHIADIKNIATVRYGGAILAALFLKAFVPKDTPWAHIDIAGPAFAEKDTDLSPYGGTGFGVRTILDFLLTED